MKDWFPDMLSQHPENCTDRLTEFHNSVTKQPPKTPLKQEKEKTTKPPKSTVHHRTVAQLHTAKYKRQSCTLNMGDKNYQKIPSTSVSLFVWAVCWGLVLFVLFLNHTTLNTFISSRKLRGKQIFSALTFIVVLSLKRIWK